ncbi:hypothetical protein HOLleu_39963 [Holothuria leucospilota]|uniref:Uncharacterized protein n=1 Tax=Holothuria leucospilota TaxID=206669 RepID=A0A9Q0YFD4_HOLLE|nr:hypothetical protein HOLleu_39963 [Holothuria leucospilota]
MTDLSHWTGLVEALGPEIFLASLCLLLSLQTLVNALQEDTVEERDIRLKLSWLFAILTAKFPGLDCSLKIRKCLIILLVMFTTTSLVTILVIVIQIVPVSCYRVSVRSIVSAQQSVSTAV